MSSPEDRFVVIDSVKTSPEDRFVTIDSVKTSPKDRFVTIDSVKTRYWKAGKSGSPIVFLHGIGAFSETWLMNFNVFSKVHRVFALDFPGHGYTHSIKRSHTIEYFARFIDAFITSQNLDRVHLIGNSFGGGIALKYATLFPRKTDKIVLVANPGFGRELSFPLRLVGMPVAGKFFIRSRNNETARRKRSISIVKGILHDMDHVDGTMRETLIDMYCRRSALPHGGWAVHDILRRYTSLFGIKRSFMEDFDRIVGEVEASALIVWGENDRVIPPEQGVLGLDKMRHAELHTIKECGHMPQLEHPDEFNRLVLQFLNH